jgi:CHASE3 domain sensor protein
MKKLRQNNAIIVSALLVLVLVVFNTIAIINNNQALKESTALKQESEQIIDQSEQVLDAVIRNIDLGLRGYALTKEEKLLGPLQSALETKVYVFDFLEESLTKQDYTDMASFYALKKGVEEYVRFSQEMIELVQKDEMEEFTQQLKLDKGYDLWMLYAPFQSKLTEFESQLVQQAEEDYKQAMRNSLLAQIVLAIIGIPTLLFMILRIRKVERNRSELFLELENNNRQHLFNPGTMVDIAEERSLITSSIHNFQKAAQFINQISKGNYEIDWQGLTDENRELNKTNLVGELMAMREQMKQLKQEDERRLWASEGMAKFSELVRSNQSNLQELCNEVVYFVVKYLGVQQGALFLVMEDEHEEEPYLELKGCYAFNRKKHLSKRIIIGEGLVGQVYLEKQTVFLTDIPQNYINITSGMGNAKPTCVVVVPMLHNSEVKAVLEIAGFDPCEPYQVEFLEKIGEITASAVMSVQTAEKTERLLEQFRQQTEMLQSQEEEMRQNMEELEATQEEMRRKELAMERSQEELRMLLEQVRSASA